MFLFLRTVYFHLRVFCESVYLSINLFIYLSRRGSLDRKEKRSSWAASESELTATLDNFPPVTLTGGDFYSKRLIAGGECWSPQLVITATQTCFAVCTLLKCYQK